MMTKKKMFRWVASLLSVATILPCVACNETESSSSVEVEEAVVTVRTNDYLYKNGISEYSILLPENANTYETFAANELAQNLEKATGNSLPILTESQLKDKEHIISLGHTSLWDEKVNLTLSREDIIDSGYYIETVENNIYISCPDNTNSSGVLYGVYDMLNDMIGYEFYAYDEIQYEETKNIPLYDYSGYKVNPSFEMRMLRNADLRDDSLTVMRYRMVYPSVAFGMATWGHGQASQYLHPDSSCTCGLDGCEGKTYQEHHPDWYSNYGTKDMQLCWTAGEELEQTVAERFVDFFEAYPDADYFMFGQEDNMSTCNCTTCKKAMTEYAGNPAGLQIAFMNNVIEKAKKLHPKAEHVKYVIYAYYGAEAAPVKTLSDGSIVPYSDKVDPVDQLYIFYTPIGANFAFQIDSTTNAEVYKNLSEWSVIADGQLLMYLYDINFRSYLINFNNFGTVKGMYETCQELGVACMTSQAADTYTSCFQEMRSYVESSLMWDLSLSYDDLVRKFMKAYYRDAADYLYAYYTIMRDRYAYYQNVISPESGGIYGTINTTLLWTQPVVDKIDKEFDKAMQAIEKYQTSDPVLYETLKNRIMKERLSPIYLKLTVLPSYYSTEELAQLKAEFKYYVNFFKFQEVQEGGDFGDLLQ